MTLAQAKKIADEAPLVEVTPIDPLTRLRAPFRPESVGKLPRIICPQCSKAQGRCCPEHAKQNCAECGNYITTRHMHLDYVGHAEVTDRLLSADPEWSWEPLSRDIDPSLLAAVADQVDSTVLSMLIENSPPHFERDGNNQPVGLWIKLTVAGVTRKGFGSVDSGKFDAEKQLIGDALRNAAMRFGVALDLWSKSELESALDETPPVQTPAADPEADAAMTELAEIIKSVNPADQREKLTSHLRGRFGKAAEMTPEDIEAAIVIAAGWPETAVAEPEQAELA